MGPATAALITGSVVIERIYSIPGLGSYFVQGALNRDYTLVMGVVVFYGVIIILLNFIVDILYAWMNPKIRYSEARMNNSVDIQAEDPFAAAMIEDDIRGRSLWVDAWHRLLKNRAAVISGIIMATMLLACSGGAGTVTLGG